MNFLLKELQPYKHILETKDVKEIKIVRECTKKHPQALSTAGSIILWFLESLESTIREIAAKQIQNSCLGAVFELNNFHVISKKLLDATSTVKRDLPIDEIRVKYEALIDSAKDKYLHFTW